MQLYYILIFPRRENFRPGNRPNSCLSRISAGCLEGLEIMRAEQKLRRFVHRFCVQTFIDMIYIVSFENQRVIRFNITITTYPVYIQLTLSIETSMEVIRHLFGFQNPYR